MKIIPTAKEVLEIEAKSLLDAKAFIDEQFEKAIDIIQTTSGKLIVTGVGKSGLVGSKIAATFASTGTSSFFLHPTEALHGDLGMIGKEDSILAISYSGESEEIKGILPHIKRNGIRIIAMTSRKDSSLAQFADAFINIKVAQEACPLNAAPTSSTTLTMALGDALAVTLMKLRGFKKEDFAQNHPGGSLGKRLFLKASDLLKRENLPIVSRETKLKDAIVVMSQGRIGNLLIINESGALEGVLSDGDLRRALMEKDFTLEKPTLEYATKNPTCCDDINILAYDALSLIEEKKIQLLVFIDRERKPIGVLHIHDLVEAGIKS